MLSLSWSERALLRVAPRWGLRRLRDRLAVDLLRRSFDAASSGRRTDGWRRTRGDGNTERRRDLVATRELSRNLIENNPYARAALTTVVDHVVGWGITARAPRGAFAARWAAWSESTACDADGRLDFAGLQQQVMRTVFESGEVLVRRRVRRVADGLPIPLQLQVLEPDYLDTLKEATLESGGTIIQGIEFDAIGRRVAYWLFPEHPGSTVPGFRGGYTQSVRIPASEILHIGEPGRPGQVRCTPWLAPVTVRLADMAEYEDATLVKQKVAACLAVIFTDPDGARVPIGVGDDSVVPGVDRLQPGMMTYFPQGATAEVVQPPSVNEYGPYLTTSLRAIATGIGVGYEDLTGDFSQVNFSSARMARLRHYDRVHAWRWRMLQPQFLDPVWGWALQLARVVDGAVPETLRADWTAPPMPMLDPNQEGQAYSRLIRNRLMSQSEALRELGFDPKVALREMADDVKTLKALGLISDSEPTVTTQGGQLQGEAAADAEPDPPPPAPAPRPAPDDEDAEARRLRELRADVIRHRERLERLEGALETVVASRNGHAPASIHVDARTTVEKGAVEAPVTVTVPPAPAAAPVTVDARTTIAEGAVQVQAPIDARTTVEKGAVRAGDVLVDAPTTIHPPEVRIEPGAVQVQAPVTIAEGAVKTEIPVTIADQVTVPAGRKRVKRDAKGRIAEIVSEGTPSQVVARTIRDAEGRLLGAEPDAPPPATD